MGRGQGASSVTPPGSSSPKPRLLLPVAGGPAPGCSARQSALLHSPGISKLALALQPGSTHKASAFLFRECQCLPGGGQGEGLCPERR